MRGASLLVAPLFAVAACGPDVTPNDDLATLPAPSGSASQLAGVTGTIAFSSERTGGISQVFVMDADGANPVQVTLGGESRFHPAWSPDGTTLVYVQAVSGMSDPNFDLYLLGPEGSRQLTDTPTREASPAWSPDGEWIAFEASESGIPKVYAVARGGGTWESLTRGDLADLTPEWSPDGTSVVYSSKADLGCSPYEAGCQRHLYAMEVATGEVTQLTSGDSYSGDPTWSPDGKLIAYSSNGRGGGDYDIYVMRGDGSRVARLTRAAGLDLTPAWSPDGRHLAFTTNRDGDYEIYVMRADGSRERDVTNDPANDYWPTWRTTPVP